MGSWAADLSKGLAEGLEKIGTKSAAKVSDVVSPEIGRGIFDPARSFEINPAAKEFHSDFMNKYQPLKAKIESVEGQAAKQHYAMTGQAPDVAGIQKRAAKQASDKVFGPDRKAAQIVLKHTEAANGKNAADILSDNMNIMFQEEVQKGGYNKGLSKFDVQMQMKHGEEEGIQGLPISKYKGGGGSVNILGKDIQVEKKIRTANKILSHAAAPIHAATAAWNISADSGFMAVPRAAWDLYGPKHEIENLMASNTISELTLNPLRERAAFDAAVSRNTPFKWMPGEVGEWLHKNMYIPGLADTRWHSVAIAAQSSKMVAMEAADRLSRNDTQYAREAFRRLDIDPDKIIAQGYKLAPEDIEKAYYHGANNKTFLNPYDATPTFWRQSPLFRGMKAFTGYVTKQAQFKRKLYLSQMRAGDFVGLARQMTLDAIAAPVAGAIIYEFDRLQNGEDWEGGAAGVLKHTVNRIKATPGMALYNEATGKKQSANAAKITLNTINMYAKLGSFGATTGYIRALNRRNLLERFAPPVANIGIQLGQDIVGAAHTDAKHPTAAKPLGRDLLSLTPLVGGALSHQVLPTRKEEDAKKAHKSHRKAVPETDWNPFHYNPDLDY